VCACDGCDDKMISDREDTEDDVSCQDSVIAVVVILGRLWDCKDAHETQSKCGPSGPLHMDSYILNTEYLRSSFLSTI